MDEEVKHTTKISFQGIYKQSKRKTARKITANQHYNQNRVSLQGNKSETWVHANRRVGTPRMNWVENGASEIWEELKQHNTSFRFTTLDHYNPHEVRALKQYAKENTT